MTESAVGSGSMGRRPRIGIVGDAGVDLTFRVSTGPDEKASVDEAVRGLGGTGANAAVAAARLGAEVRIACTVGDDALGPWVLAALEAAEVGTDWSSARPGRTEVAVMTIEDGQRRLFVDPGIGYEHDLGRLRELRAWADVVYGTHVQPRVVEAFVGAEGHSQLVVGLESRDLATPGWREALVGVDVLITNQAGAEGARALVDPARTARVVTMARDGAVLHEVGRSITIAAPSVTVIDATGAGDCLAGVLCQSLGLGLDLEAATRRAVAAATLSTTRLGTQTAFPRSDELRAAI